MVKVKSATANLKNKITGKTKLKSSKISKSSRTVAKNQVAPLNKKKQKSSALFVVPNFESREKKEKLIYQSIEQQVKSKKQKAKKSLVRAPQSDNEDNKDEVQIKPEKSESKIGIVTKEKASISPLLQSKLSQYQINVDDIVNAINGVVKIASNNPHLQNQLFNEEFPLFLQVNSFKVPKTKDYNKHLFRVPLTHSIFSSESDICLIVPDVKGIPNKEHERHEEHYEQLLRSKNVTGIKKIMTFHEFRTEYETFELKSRLADLYDVFLVDGKISGKVVHKGGNVFYKKRKVPISIKLGVSKLKDHIETALRKAYFDINLKSDSCMVQFGHSNMTIDDLVENVCSVIEFLDDKFPGKMPNIRSLNVYAHRGSSIPIYVSLANPNEVKVPVLKPSKPKAYKSYTGELTTQDNADVVVRPSGRVIVKRKLSENNQNGNNETNKNISTENVDTKLEVKPKIKRKKSNKSKGNK